MNTCDRFRPLLSSFAEGEARPDEALGVARHLAGCTACKIVLARERRLHEALDGLGDAVTVDEEFARLVMAALPVGPPPRADGARRRGLKLAGLLGVSSVVGALAFRVLHIAVAAEPLRLASRLDFESGSGLLDGLARIVGAVAVLIGGVAAGLPARLPFAGGIAPGGLGPWLAAGALLTVALFLAATTWTVAGRPRGSRQSAPVAAGQPDAPRY